MTYTIGHIGTDDYATTIIAGKHTLVADETADNGGKDLGMAPFDLLTSALVACTAITLRMYAARKSWPLRGLDVTVRLDESAGHQTIHRSVILHGDLTSAQVERLADIVERTPVTKTLKAGLHINTALEIERLSD